MTHVTRLNLPTCLMFKYSHELSAPMSVSHSIHQKWGEKNIKSTHFIASSISPKCRLFSNPYFYSDFSVMAVVLQCNAFVDFKCIVTLLLNWAK